MQYKPSVLTASLISASIEIYLKLKLKPDTIKESGFDFSVILVEIQISNEMWEQLVSTIFGSKSGPYIDRFGRYLVFKLQGMYKRSRLGLN